MILEGKVAIVAGVGPGIGAGVAHVLAEEGADLAALDINQGNADKVALCSGYHYPQDSGKSLVERTNFGFAA